MTPYEIRLDVTKLAAELLQKNRLPDEQAFNAAVRAKWTDSMSPNDIAALARSIGPKPITAEEVNALASQLYSFVSDSSSSVGGITSHNVTSSTRRTK